MVSLYGSHESNSTLTSIDNYSNNKLMILFKKTERDEAEEVH